MMGNISLEDTDCSRILEEVQYYTDVIVQSFDGFICKGMGKVPDCHVLLSRSLSSPFRPCRNTYLLEILYISLEQIRSFNND